MVLNYINEIRPIHTLSVLRSESFTRKAAFTQGLCFLAIRNNVDAKHVFIYSFVKYLVAIRFHGQR